MAVKIATYQDLQAFIIRWEKVEFMKVLVKVGKESDLKLRGAELKRAITMKEAKKALDKDTFDKVIFEEVDEKAFSKLEEISIDRGAIIIYNRIENTAITDKAKASGMEVYSTAKELEQYIEKLAGVVGLGIKSSNEVLEDTNKLEKELGIGEKKGVAEEESSDNFDYSQYGNSESSNKQEDKESIEKGEGVKTEFIQASADIEYLEAQLDSANEANKNLLEVVNMLEAKVDDYKKKLDCIYVSEEVAEVTWAGANEKKLLEQLEELKHSLDEMGSIKIEYEMLKKSMKNGELTEIEHKKDLDKLKDRIDAEVGARITLSKVVKELAWKQYKVKKELEARNKEIGTFIQTVNDLERQVKEANNGKQDALKQVDEVEKVMTEQIFMLTGQVDDLMRDLEENSYATMLHDEAMKEKESKIERLSSLVAELEDKIDSTQLAMNEQNNEISRFRSLDLEEMNENIAALQESNATLASEIGNYRRVKEELQRQIDNKEKQIIELRKSNGSLGVTARSLSRSADAGETIRIKCDYTGKAFILPVFGSGSYGVTATTVAIANKLKGKILVVDFDIVNPKLDGWYKLSPIVDELPELSNQLKKTGMGCLIEKGLSYILEHEELVIRTVSGVKGSKNRIDYFSGSYTKIDMYKLMAVNFSEFFTYYGNEYDYIVVDCGRLGGSEMSTAIIRMLNEISFKNIIVGLSNDNDARTVALRMRAESIDGAKTVWVLNMNRRKIMGDLMKKSIVYAANYAVVSYSPDIYGENVELDKHKDTAGYIDKVVSLILK